MTEKKVTTEKVTNTEGPVIDTKKTGATNNAARHYPSWVVWTIVGIGLLALIIGGLVAYAAKRALDRPDRDSSGAGIIRIDRPRYFGGDRNVYVDQSQSDGLTTRTTRTTYTETKGVVTKVEGETLTIAGNGRTQTIKTNDKTEFPADKKPVVNDSVIVLGTENDGTLTATEVRIINL